MVASITYSHFVALHNARDGTPETGGGGGGKREKGEAVLLLRTYYLTSNITRLEVFVGSRPLQGFLPPPPPLLFYALHTLEIFCGEEKK